MSRIFYVNGKFVPEAQAFVSVLDRGFLFADGVYEVSSVLDGKLVDNAAHLVRLRRSLCELDMASPLDDAGIEAVQLELIKRNALYEGILYLQITRGVADRNFGFPVGATPTVVMFTQQKNILGDPTAARGLRVITVADMRWQRRDIKTVGLLGACMAKAMAGAAGVDDAWMVENALVTEGTSNNAYIVRVDGAIQTRQLGHEILNGITRAAVMVLCRETGREVIEKPFSVDQAKAASEAFITSASSFVMPVVEIDGAAVGSGRPGPVTQALREQYIRIARERQSFS